MTLEDLNVNRLLECCGSPAWARQTMARRPFQDLAALETAAEEIWWSLPEPDWLEAFSAHPKIGDASTARWSADEQRGMKHADCDLAAEMRHLNREYEKKFGWIFIVCATGKSASEMHRQLQERIANNPAAEIRIAAAEQAKITRLRLHKLVVE
ncbi:MAG TPA: 2-oxo-4-hydroxy-4-carboxy-5-ureidoimidazoline decarboxylase [Bryobacteraceae bacterium]|jgi:2-oxo-4-hydroxy-4-carboxy-5-ureidoimidazoline decarboxylase